MGYSITFTAINTQAWDSLPEETRAAMTAALADMENRACADAEVKVTTGVACLTGGACATGEAGTAAVHEPGESDIATRQAILDGFVLTRWGERCGADCATRWNDTAGKAAGLSVPAN